MTSQGRTHAYGATLRIEHFGQAFMRSPGCSTRDRVVENAETAFDAEIAVIAETTNRF